MSLFKNLFGNLYNQENSENNAKPKPDGKSFDELFESYAGLSFEKQMNLLDVIGEDHTWWLDVDKGVLSFNENLDCRAQIIGTLSYNDNSWLWGWSNTKSELPEHVLQHAKQLKKWGEKNAIYELTDERLTVEANFEHKVGVLACGYLDTSAYYTMDNGGNGVIVATLQSDALPKINIENLLPILRFSELLSAVEIHNHKEAFKNYAMSRQLKVDVTADTIRASLGDKAVIAKFDSSDRLIALEGKI